MSEPIVASNPSMSKLTYLFAGIVILSMGIAHTIDGNMWYITFIFFGITLIIGAFIEKRIGWLN